jgi:hypothetical protein
MQALYFNHDNRTYEHGKGHREQDKPCRNPVVLLEASRKTSVSPRAQELHFQCVLSDIAKLLLKRLFPLVLSRNAAFDVVPLELPAVTFK